MNESISANTPSAVRFAAGTDRFGEQRGLGISTIAFKVTMPNPGDPFILENTFLAKSGPARHLHYEQEEWFYVLEGEFQFEVGATILLRKLSRQHDLVKEAPSNDGETDGKMDM